MPTSQTASLVGLVARGFFPFSFLLHLLLFPSKTIPVVIIITPVGLCASCAPRSSNCPADATHTQTHEPSNGRRANYPQLPKKFEKQQVAAIQCRRHNNSRGKRYLHVSLSLVFLLFQLWNTHKYSAASNRLPEDSGAARDIPIKATRPHKVSSCPPHLLPLITL